MASKRSVSPPSPKERVIEDARARVQSGDFGASSVILDALGSPDREIRLHAAYRLGEIGSAATIGALSDMAANDSHPENRSQALHALFAIGRPAVVPTLLASLRDEDAEPRAAARTALYNLFGRELLTLLSDEEESGEHDPDEARRMDAWWSKNRKRFDPKIVYFLGEPAGPDVFIRQMKASKSGGLTVSMTALQAWTGLDLGPKTTAKVIAKLDKWWAENRSKYEPGHRYYYGHKVPTK